MKKKIFDLVHTKWKVSLLWFLLPLVATFIQTFYDKGSNNYEIYKYVYYHTLECKDLYQFYPESYIDKNHYGVLFSLIIGPFSYLPDKFAIVLYQFIQLFCLHYAIRKLPLTVQKQNILLLFLLAEAIANCQNLQTNTFIAFIIVGAFVSITQKKELRSALFIMLGFFVKIYGIVGLGLFFFIRNKVKFILGLLFFGLLFYFLPLFITNPNFIKSSYISWFTELSAKNAENISLSNTNQNISAIGIVMRVLQNNSFNVLLIILPAFVLQIIPLVRFRLWQNQLFQLKYLATLLLFVILYSTSTETSTHIIGATGLGIWWLTSKNYKDPKMLWFILFCFVLGTLSTTDLVPRYFNEELARKYSLKALPYWIVWFICIYQLLLNRFQIKVYEQ